MEIFLSNKSLTEENKIKLFDKTETTFHPMSVSQKTVTISKTNINFHFLLSIFFPFCIKREQQTDK